MNKLVPLGHYVLVEDAKFEQTTESGIILTSNTETLREQEGQEIGRIIAFGPIAFKDIKGCTCPEDWGVAVGDLVEYSAKYEGKKSAFCKKGATSDLEVVSRLLPDTSLVSKVEE